MCVRCLPVLRQPVARHASWCAWGSEPQGPPHKCLMRCCGRGAAGSIALDACRHATRLLPHRLIPHLHAALCRQRPWRRRPKAAADEPQFLIYDDDAVRGGASDAALWDEDEAAEDAASGAADLDDGSDDAQPPWKAEAASEAPPDGQAALLQRLRPRQLEEFAMLWCASAPRRRCAEPPQPAPPRLTAAACVLPALSATRLQGGVRQGAAAQPRDRGAGLRPGGQGRQAPAPSAQHPLEQGQQWRTLPTAASLTHSSRVRVPRHASCRSGVAAQRRAGAQGQGAGPAEARAAGEAALHAAAWAHGRRGRTSGQPACAAQRSAARCAACSWEGRWSTWDQAGSRPAHA